MKGEKLMPELRFPGFEGEWEEKRLGGICKISSGLSKDQNTENKGYRVTRIETISEGYINLEKVGYVDTESDIESYRLKLGDILFSNINSVSHIGKTAIVSEDNSLYHGMNLLRLSVNSLNSAYYIYYKLNTISYRNYFRSICNQAVSQASINQTELGKTTISLPSLPEQQKIADFLSSVDKKIELLENQLKLQEEYKKGMMQKLFSQQIRFKDDNGNDFPDWKEKRLGDCINRITRKTKNSINNILTISAGKGFCKQEDRFNRIIAGNSIDNYTLLFKDEFSYNRGASKTKRFGCIYKLNDYEEALVPNVYHSFILKEGIPDFFEYSLQTSSIDRQLRSIISSSARLDGLLNITFSNFSEITVEIPSLPEQQKIADFLSSLDKKIDNTKQQLEKAKDWKKGLMQQMFV